MIYIGNIVNTHGIKGELKILSDIRNKEVVFKKGNIVTIENQEFTINSYRVHKNFDMITLNEYNDINQVIIYKGKKVFVDKKYLPANILFDEDYIGLDVLSDRYIGKIVDIMKNLYQDIFVIQGNEKTYYVPNVKAFIKNIDFDKKELYINEIEGLIDEN